MANGLSLSAQLSLDIRNFASNLSKASRQMSTFAKNTNDAYGKATAALQTHTMELKSTARIIQGIMVSQAFYGIARSVREATGALFEFNEQLDYMKVTYSALFGSTEIAQDFMKTLQEHSINTIFEFGELADASKKLLAYGIEYENLMFVMEGLTNLGAMSGDMDAMARAARAIGQIFTKGTLKAEEMKQLADAYIPIYDIIQSSFGLSQADMARVGDLKLPAEDVINAIVDYSNAKFSGVADAAMMTITGLKNRIVDTFKVLGTEMLEPFTAIFKSFLVYVDRNLADIRALYNKSGFGGIFEAMVPDPAVQEALRRFVANLQNLINALISSFQIVGKFAGELFMVFVSAFNAIQPVITSLINITSYLIYQFSQTTVGAAALRIAAIGAAAALAILTIQTIRATVVSALTALINGLSKALMILSAVISTLARTPLGIIFLALSAGLVGVAVSSTRASNAISDFFNKLSGAGNKSYEDVFKKTTGEINNSAAAADSFNNRLGEGADAANELGDGIDGAGKKAKKASKSLLAFDEVFRLNEPDSSAAGSGGLGAGLMEGLEGLMGGLNSLGDALIPKIPDFSDFIKDYTDGLFGGLKDTILSSFSNMVGTNTILGAITGILKTLVKMFPIAFGKTVADMLKSIKAGSFAGFFKNIASVFTADGLKALAKGGLIGAAIGFVVDGIAAMLWRVLAEKFNLSARSTGNAMVGQTIGSVLGTIIGGLMGGPAGALIGSAIGTFAGGFIGLFWEKIKEFLTPAAAAITDFTINTAKLLGGWFIDTLDRLSGWIWETTDLFAGWLGETLGGFFKWVADTVALFTDWENINSDTIGRWWNETTNSLSTWWENTLAGFDVWYRDTVAGLVVWIGDTLSGFIKWGADTFGVIGKWATNTLNSIIKWMTDTRLRYEAWVDSVVGIIVGWASTTWNTFTTWASTALQTITGFCIAALATFIKWCAEVIIAIETWFVGLIKDIKVWWENLWNTSKWAKGWDLIKGWFSDLFKSIGSWMSDVAKSVSNWWSNLWSDKNASVNIAGSVNSSSPMQRSLPGPLPGHATGGIFSREHIARFAEGNRAEAVIPLENATAMQPFVDAISRGILEGLAPTMLQSGNSNQNLPPLYVGTLVADERGLKQLYKKFELIRVQENARKGMA